MVAFLGPAFLRQECFRLGSHLTLTSFQNIREVYSFIAANYTPGDDIVLIGFSRGAFTSRSVAAMIGDIGLLTR